jgi:hypothetical protein
VGGWSAAVLWEWGGGGVRGDQEGPQDPPPSVSLLLQWVPWELCAQGTTGGWSPWVGCGVAVALEEGAGRGRSTTSQPPKGACEQNSTAPLGPSWRHLEVCPIPPADWGTRSTRSHLGKRPEHEIPDFYSRRGGLRGVPRSGPGLPERGWGPRWLGFESVPGGVPTGSTQHRRGAGAPEGARSTEDKKCSPQEAPGSGSPVRGVERRVRRSAIP